MNAELMAVLTITELIMKHGVPLALQMITVWEVEEPTIEDWEALRVKDPESYFQSSPSTPSA